jgi:diguanylate cyclase (GGDEF)-like protein
MIKKDRNDDVLDKIFFIIERIVIFDGLDDVFEHVLKTAVQLTRAEASTLRLFDVKSGKLKIVKGYELSNGFLSQPPLKIGEGIVGRVVMEGKPFFTSNVLNVKECVNKELAKLEGIRAVMCVPLKTKDGAIGCITVYRKTEEPFAEHDQLLLGIFASQTVEAVEKARFVNELRKQAMFDSLTSVYNKNALLAKLEKETKLALRHDYKTSVIFIDLDDFKAFNDQNGHLLGDKLLRDFVELLAGQCRKTDIVGRFGGEEFVIVVPHTDKKGAETFADKLRGIVEAHSFIGRDGSAHITLSAGVACFPDDGENTYDILKKADDAMYQCKKAGKNKVKAC